MNHVCMYYEKTRANSVTKIILTDVFNQVELTYFKWKCFYLLLMTFKCSDNHPGLYRYYIDLYK